MAVVAVVARYCMIIYLHFLASMCFVCSDTDIEKYLLPVYIFTCYVFLYMLYSLAGTAIVETREFARHQWKSKLIGKCSKKLNSLD